MELYTGEKFATFDADRIAAAAQVGRAISFEQILLASASMQIGKSSIVGRSGKIRISLVPSANLVDESHLRVSLSFALDLKDAALPEVSYAKFNVEYALSYGLTVPPPPEEHRDRFFSAFAEINSVHNAWPYLREFVHGMAGRMGMPQVLLPVFRITGGAKVTTPATVVPASAHQESAEPSAARPPSTTRRRRRTG